MSSHFRTLLSRRNPPKQGRRWVFVAPDQLSDRIGPLARTDARRIGIVLVEAPWKAGLRPYHRQKLALVLANLRHFALEQAARGVAVRHVVSPGPYRAALEPLARELGPLAVMEPAECELRQDIAPLVASGALEVVPHEGWLTTSAQFAAACGEHPPFRMDAFYRHVRRANGILVERGKPVGGKYSFDADNRRAWRGEPPAPEPPRFEPDAITREVGELVERRFARHPGRLDLGGLPATAEDARRAWEWARRECLERFGPFEDAMSAHARGLFHTRIAALVNLHRLLPREVVADALALEIPLASKEGFVRQVLGWREFVRHVHRATDGFRRDLGFEVARHAGPPDGGWSRWSGSAWSASGITTDAAAPGFLGAGHPLPPAYWGAASGLACLDATVRAVWEDGWTHHIPRLMVLANIATLLDVSPRELTDWFWAAFVDAYDWVVEPNVLGMGTFAAGDVMTTKPYVAGSAYVERMSDHCSTCRFSPGKDCPLTRLYWAFLDRHAAALAGNQRMALPLRSLARRPAAERRADAQTFERTLGALAAGRALEPGSPDRW